MLTVTMVIMASVVAQAKVLFTAVKVKNNEIPRNTG